VPASGSARTGKPKKRSSAFLFARDAGIALLLVGLILVTMYAYTGLWPPLVVVESNSMMHGEDNLSHVGTIDTGDLVLVRAVGRVSEVRTYMDGYVSGHRTYGDYGDVVIYKPGGTESRTPIIHRAIIYLEYDSTSDCYRSASLEGIPKDVPGAKWSTTNADDTWDHLTSALRIYHVGWDDLTISIDVAGMISSHRSGFITKGDHNTNVDQMFASSGPVDIGWVVGKARGEIPWFGLLKLWTTDSLGSPAPENSVRNLWISMILIVVAPVMVDIGLTYREKKAIARKGEESADGPADLSDEAPVEDTRVEAGSPGEEIEEPPERLT